MKIEIDDLSRAEVLALLDEHLQNMHELSPPESVHALDLDKLRQPDITFWSAWDGPVLLGCGALKELDRQHGEVKSMRTSGALRRQGAGRSLLAKIIAVARSRGYERLSLETGAMEAFTPAQTLYESFGFVRCGPFGGYVDDPNSVFMTLSLVDHLALGNLVSEPIREASGEQDYKAFAQLISEYVAWLRLRYEEDAWFINQVLDRQSLSSELESLPTVYGPPNGRVFVAMHGNEVRGCGGYRRIADGVCEMKRVFVPARFQGTGLGRRICSALLSSARADGFKLMKLDSGKRLKEAFALYQSLGFRECPPYYPYPEALMPYFVFMDLPLLVQSAVAAPLQRPAT